MTRFVEDVVEQAIVGLELDDVGYRRLFEKRDDLLALISNGIREVVEGDHERGDDGMSGFALLP